MVQYRWQYSGDTCQSNKSSTNTKDTEDEYDDSSTSRVDQETSKKKVDLSLSSAMKVKRKKNLKKFHRCNTRQDLNKIQND